MANKTLFEPMTIVSRCIKPTLNRSPTRMALTGTVKQPHRTAATSSNVSSSAYSKQLQPYSKPESDDDIEVFGPFPDHSLGKTKENSTRAKPTQPKKPTVQPDKFHTHVFSAQPLRPRSNIHASTSASVSAVAAFGTSCSTSTTTNGAPSFSSVVSLEPPVPEIAGLAITRASKMITTTTTARARARKRTKTAAVVDETTLDLPVYSYKDYTDPKPHLVYTTDESEADDLVGALKRTGPVAFDMEWHFYTLRDRNNPYKLVERRTAVVQIADEAGLILVIQIYGMNRFPKQLQALIEDPNIAKMGVNIMNDGKKLFRDYGILAKNLVELGAIALVADPAAKTKRKIVSLAKLTARFCNKLLNKEERSSNWEEPLDLQQRDYAANDVHSTILIYQRLLAVAQDQSVKLPPLTTFGADVEPYFDSPALSRASSSSTTTSSSATAGSGSSQGVGVVSSLDVMEMRPQYLRAYRYWYEDNMNMDEMCVKLSLKGKGSVGGVLGEGLKVGTVITYIISALQANPKLPFEMLKLKDLVQMDGASWVRHRAWILTAWSEGLGVQPAEEGMEEENGDEMESV